MMVEGGHIPKIILLLDFYLAMILICYKTSITYWLGVYWKMLTAYKSQQLLQVPTEKNQV